MTRVAITGGPRTGKTTLADKLVDDGHRDFDRAMREAARDAIALAMHRPPMVRHTDDTIGKHTWSEGSRVVSTWMDEPGPWIIEGVSVSRALRKWSEAHPGERPPVDRVIYLLEPHETLTPGQATMAKGVRTVHDEIEPWLAKHGIVTEYR